MNIFINFHLPYDEFNGFSIVSFFSEENLSVPNLRSATMEKIHPKKVKQLTKDDINIAGSFR